MKKYGLMKPGMIIYTGSFRIKRLIKDIERNGCLDGIGNPEALRGDLQGEYSRRIDEKNRLVYHMEDGRIFIAACRGHYGDK